MKFSKILLVMLVAAALVIAPAMAARDGSIVHSGDSIFVSEENLNLKALGTGTSSPAEDAKYDDIASATVAYTGSWTSDTEISSAYLGTRSFSNTAGNTVSFAFTGTRVIVYAGTQDNGGTAVVTIDGDTVATINCFNATEGYDIPIYDSGYTLDDEAHTLMVTVNGDGYVIVDAFRAMTDATTASNPTMLQHFDGGVSDGTVDGTITLTNGMLDVLLETMVDEKYGIWYAADSGGVITPHRYVDIKKPSLTIDIVLFEDKAESIAGDSVTRDTLIAFKVTNNVGSAFTSGTPTYDIEVSTDGGATYTAFGGEDLAAIVPTSSLVYTGDVDLSTVDAGSYKVKAKWSAGTDFYGEGFDSAQKTFSVSSKSLSIVTNKDTVVSGKHFSVTVTGESNTEYYLYIETTDTDIPKLISGQVGVVDADGDGITNENEQARLVTTSSGTRTAEFDTEDADDASYTIRVEEVGDASKFDTVKVKVEEGDITISVKDDKTSFHLGAEITFDGINTQTDDVYLFITGPNLGTGRSLKDVTVKPVDNDANTFGHDEVEVDDDTWEFKWSTADAFEEGALDSGSYTIWAVADPMTKDSLDDTVYATTTISLKRSGVSIDMRSSVAKGDTIYVQGTASGDPDNVYVWIFGKNYRNLFNAVDVEDDGTFKWEIPGTEDFASGQYYVVVQHPMSNGKADVYESGTGDKSIVSSTNPSTIVNLAGLQASDAATALTDEIDSSAIDDIYDSHTFYIEDTIIRIDQTDDQVIGSKVKISGTTNLEVDNELIVEVVGASFNPTSKDQSAGFDGTTRTVTVTSTNVSGALNVWTTDDIDTNGWKADQYMINVESVESGITATAVFDLLNAPTSTPTPVTTPTTVSTTPTATPTPIQTPTQITTQPTPVATTKSPGFGIVIALGGLCVVGYMMTRRH